MRIHMIILLLLILAVTRGYSELLMSPINLDINNNSKMTTLRIDNRSNEDSILQIRVKSWDSTKQVSNEVAISPPRVHIPAGEYQMVRFVNLLGDDSSNEQRMYRVIVDELNISDKQLPNGLSVSMRYLLPLSIGGDDLIYARTNSLRVLTENWTNGLKFKRSGKNQISVQNIRNSYARLSKVVLVNAKSKEKVSTSPGLLGYVLANSEQSFGLNYLSDEEFDHVELVVNGVRLTYPLAE